MPDHLWENPDLANEQARTHALVIGVSAYAYLPGGHGLVGGPAPGETLGLRQVSTPATAAFAFARWLREGYRNRAAPLGSLRLLLSPSTTELQGLPELADWAQNGRQATRDHVLAALKQWQAACRVRSGDVAVLYAAGHGVQTSREGAILLLEDFADPAGENVFTGAVDLECVRRSMVPAPGVPDGQIAQQQFFFVDCCRVEPARVAHYASFTGVLGLDEAKTTQLPSSAVFYAATSGGYAFGTLGKGTVFCQALLDCLGGTAADPPRSDGVWRVATSSLVRALPHAVGELGRSLDLDASACVGGEFQDGCFHELERPPPVDLSLGVDPDNAAGSCKLTLRRCDGQPELADTPFVPRVERQVEAGNYSAHVDATAPYTDGFRSFMALPPSHREDIVVKQEGSP